jgi:hypothetical protein
MIDLTEKYFVVLFHSSSKLFFNKQDAFAQKEAIYIESYNLDGIQLKSYKYLGYNGFVLLKEYI